MTFRSWPVFRRSITRRGLSVEREFWWWVEPEEGPKVRRCVFDAHTGEILDDVWIDDEGRVRSYSAPGRRQSDAPDGSESSLVEAVEPTTTGTDDDMVENGGDDGSLSRQGQVGPRLPQSGRVADVPLDDRDAA